MSDFSFSAVSPLIADQRVHGRSVMVSFRCPVTQITVPSQFTLPQGSQVAQRMKSAAGRTMGYEMRRVVTSVLRAALGRSLMGRVAASVADEAMRHATSTVAHQTSSHTLSPKEVQEAIVEAFKGVSGQFTWDPRGKRWVALAAMKEAMSPFQRRITDAPVQHPYDQAVLARMLVEIAASDGQLADEEKDFLGEFLDPSLGSVDSILQRPPLTPAELAQTSQGAVRETLLTLAWVLTLADESYQQAEADKIALYAHALGISQAAHGKILKDAQSFLLDQALERMIGWGGHDAHARREFMATAARLGVSETEAQAVEAAFQRRKGSV